jgi:1-acyl-sn-glycerol-3-phosphate acyltransferase
LRAALLAMLRLVLRLRVEGLDRVPATGPVLVVSNHLHNADPILNVIAFPRPVHYMAKKEAFGFPLFRWVLRWGGAFPVDRGKADRAAIRRAEATLAHGIAIGIFPEGTRSLTRALQPAHAGAGLLALRSGAPVLPMAITGTERLPFNGAKGRVQAQVPLSDPGHRGVRIRFGELFKVPAQLDGRRVTPEEATEIIMVEIARLLPPDYRGVYAERLSAEGGCRRAEPVGS